MRAIRGIVIDYENFIGSSGLINDTAQAAIKIATIVVAWDND
jgi:hypothetical protein